MSQSPSARPRPPFPSVTGYRSSPVVADHRPSSLTASPRTRPARRFLVGAAATFAAATTGVLVPAASGAAYTADPGDRLTVTVREAGGGANGTFELRCHPEGGSHPAVRDACSRLDRRTTWGKDPFAPVPSGTVCTMQYGGPATAHVTGTWAGRHVDARFDRGNGCEIARWDALVPVLPAPHS